MSLENELRHYRTIWNTCIIVLYCSTTTVLSHWNSGEQRNMSAFRYFQSLSMWHFVSLLKFFFFLCSVLSCQFFVFGVCVCVCVCVFCCCCCCLQCLDVSENLTSVCVTSLGANASFLLKELWIKRLQQLVSYYTQRYSVCVCTCVWVHAHAFLFKQWTGKAMIQYTWSWASYL